MTGRIHSVESFSAVDGPGTRFVVFFQGCPMRCLYCHNPDTWRPDGGREVTAEDILSEYDAVKEFMHNGGITCTGGEPCLQIGFLTELFEKAKSKSINTCLDTSGITFNPKDTAAFDRLIKSTDLVMLDIKHIDPEKHKKLTGHDNKGILAFAEYLSDNGIPVWIRHVVVPDITDDEESLDRLGHFLARIKTLKALDVLPYHTLGRHKYEELGMDYPLGDTPPMSKDGALHARDLIMRGLKDELRQSLAK
ncbi:MAG: pyruvate formate lyase-activating protein [Ruminococcus sp.]|uniref:pyruvate formate-lyase-activating protein n=1 Tax=Ruminococcus sp. TaxID=41978 RepID=UPI0026015EAC|nr:pyruvate formate-lyase-activating protein [Ruminococcus sp.]MBO4867789.1 pyruvate formate lyase-activating protein [Ruminococcus sp.]